MSAAACPSKQIALTGPGPGDYLSGQVATRVRWFPEGVFAMNELAPIRNFDLADEALLLNTIDRWLEKEVRPVVKEHDHADRWPAEIVEQMREFGLFGATVSPEYGGLGLPAVTYARIVMRISSVWMAITCFFIY